jgi:hypothetical protein
MLAETAGYVPVPLSAGDYIELLPAVWRAVNAYGIKISHRTYDAEGLNPIRQQKSGVAARKGQWEVHRDPYDVSRVFVRGPDGWITCRWKYLDKVPAPFGELAWDHVSARLAEQGHARSSELERALAVDDLLRRAYHGPPHGTGTDEPGAPPRKGAQRKRPARDRRVAARTRAASPRHGGPEDSGLPSDAPAAGGAEEEPSLAKVIPMPIFDPFAEADKPW